MRTLSLPVRLAILLPFAALGCSGVGGKSGVSPNIRTITSVGDQPLPVVEGAPGAKVAADRESPARRTDPQGRISGRVLDLRGKPVPNARVRIATSGAERGQVVRTMTDGSGGFTLHGLRPGGEYTVIAEADDRDGVITGRIRARAPDTQVRIRLRDLEDPPAPGTRRISPASNRDEVENSDSEPQSSPRINEEDLPPAPEAEALAEPPRSRIRRPVLQLDAPVQGTGWQRSGNANETSREGPFETSPTEVNDSESTPTRRPAQPAPALPDDDEGPNPLPPATERNRSENAPAPAAAHPAAAPEAAPAAAEPAPAVAPAASTPVPQPTATDPAPAPEAAPPAAEPPASTEAPVATQPPVAAEPPAAASPSSSSESSASPASESSGSGSTPGATAPETPPQTSAAAPAPGGIVAASPTPPTKPEPLEPPGLWPADNASSASSPERQGPAKRPTWAELTAQYPALAVPADNPNSIVQAPSAGRSQAAGTWAPRSAPVTRVAAHSGDSIRSTCRYDSRRQRMYDFRLPDLQGQPVRFRDLDADYVLLDFWGTWCGPCRKAIPHLVQLQKQLGPERLRVVGIAYEEGTPAERAAAVAETAQRLGINYTLLLGGLDGACPLQTALKVQAYPTLILLDRSGKLLWRDTGVSPDTLSRLDRVIASATRSDVVRR